MFDAIDWQEVGSALDREGVAVLPQLLDADACRSFAALYDDTGDGTFRSRVVMSRHNFGRGEYKYFAYPLPQPLPALRTALYAQLAPIANRWSTALGNAQHYPATHAEYLARCHVAGQTRATPLLLRYGEGDYNCLHQDLYGEHVFPLQVVVLLSEPARDFEGGEFVLVEQRPRMQSRRDRGAAAAGRCGGVRRPSSAGARHAWTASRDDAARREPRSARRPQHAGDHLPRRGLRACLAAARRGAGRKVEP